MRHGLMNFVYSAIAIHSIVWAAGISGAFITWEWDFLFVNTGLIERIAILGSLLLGIVTYLKERMKKNK